MQRAIFGARSFRSVSEPCFCVCENVFCLGRIWGNRLFFLGFQIGRMLFFGCEMVM